MKKFYLSIASGSQMATAVKFRFQDVLINHQSKMSLSFKRREFHDSVFVDCGGFSSSLIRGGYRTSDEDYLSYVQRIGADLFSLRDYPCEPTILQKWGRTAVEHIEMTVDHHISLLERCNDLKAEPVGVLQGWSIKDYLYCLDRFREQGLILKRMAIGSICRRGSQSVTRKIVYTLSRELNNVKLHGFGISLNALRYKDVWDSLYSADSGAWDFASRWNKLRSGLSKREASESELAHFLHRLHHLKYSHELQRNLYSFEF